MTDYTPRPAQQRILAYNGGKMGISAVPGSGKTWTLSALAAQIIARGTLNDEQEVLIVTLVNSAVDNFAGRIGNFIRSGGMIRGIGYRVRTLHGLAHDIVREKPGLAGLSDKFSILDEREAGFIRRDAVSAWLAAHSGELDIYLKPDLEPGRLDWLRREQLPDMIESLALAFIRSAKDRRLTADALRERLDRSPAPLPLAELGWTVYNDYQRALAYRGAVDFDDLIRLALDLLERDAEFLDRLRYRWPFILEDEAQDSSQLQETILRLLAGPEGNWVRVGDPNQAIFETFTTASPKYLRRFIAEEADFQRELPDSGRSQPSIISLANRMIDWVMAEHPEPAVRDALGPPHIRPAPEGDPQPNPPDDPSAIRFISRKFTPDEEVTAVADSLERWLPEHPDATVAVLVPRNLRGVDVIDELKKRKLPYFENLNSTVSTRTTAGALAHILAWLAEPGAAARLGRVYQVWRREWREGEEAQTGLYRDVAAVLRKCRTVEEYLDPLPAQDWVDTLEPETDPAVIGELRAFRETARRWQGTVTLPVDQLILTIARELFSASADLALAYKLALVLAAAARAHPEWRLPELTEELGVIARNERRFIGFSSDDSGFDPDQHRGQVVVTTMHKAKGLEWDRVYLMSVNNYDFPSAQPYDRYIAEKWFLAEGLNLEAEALAQLEMAGAGGEFDWYEQGRATREARLDYVRERLRLLYVAVTRARRELIVTFNSGRQGDAQPALPMVALREWWSEQGQVREP